MKKLTDVAKELSDISCAGLSPSFTESERRGVTSHEPYSLGPRPYAVDRYHVDRVCNKLFDVKSDIERVMGRSNNTAIQDASTLLWRLLANKHKPALADAVMALCGPDDASFDEHIIKEDDEDALLVWRRSRGSGRRSRLHAVYSADGKELASPPSGTRICCHCKKTALFYVECGRCQHGPCERCGVSKDGKDKTQLLGEFEMKLD